MRYFKVLGPRLGDADGERRPQTRHEKNTSPRRSIRRSLEAALGTRLEMLLDKRIGKIPRKSSDMLLNRHTYQGPNKASETACSAQCFQDCGVGMLSTGSTSPGTRYESMLVEARGRACPRSAAIVPAMPTSWGALSGANIRVNDGRWLARRQRQWAMDQSTRLHPVVSSPVKLWNVKKTDRRIQSFRLMWLQKFGRANGMFVFQKGAECLARQIYSPYCSGVNGLFTGDEEGRIFRPHQSLWLPVLYPAV
jgi:hypothetical protein